MIRVTPIDGEPIDLSEDTPCVSETLGLGARCTQLHSAAATAGTDLYFVRFGDAWPLCTVERSP